MRGSTFVPHLPPEIRMAKGTQTGRQGQQQQQEPEQDRQRGRYDCPGAQQEVSWIHGSYIIWQLRTCCACMKKNGFFRRLNR